MGFKKAKDFEDKEKNKDIIEEGSHNLFWVPNNKIDNVRIINKVKNFFVIFVHKKYINNVIKMKICDKDEIIGNNVCNLCKNNKSIKVYLTEVLPLDYYYNPKQLKTKLWIVPPYKYSDVFEKFDIIQNKFNRNYDIKNFIFIIKRDYNKYTMSYDNNHNFNHNFISADEDYWINYLKKNYYDIINL